VPQPELPANGERIDRTEHLLRLLTDLSPSQPPSRVRERLAVLSEARLGSKRFSGRCVWIQTLAFPWPVFATVTILAILGIVVVRSKPGSSRPAAQSQARSSVQLAGRSDGPSPQSETAIHAVDAQPAHRRHAPRPLVTPTKRNIASPLIVHLPYSNSEISTGTSTTVRISMAQSQLVALGFPLPPMASGSRVLADVALGDDGLPRSITLPLPLRVLKEN